MKWLKQFFKSSCDCWACKNIRAGGGYQPCQSYKKTGEPKAPPHKP